MVYVLGLPLGAALKTGQSRADARIDAGAPGTQSKFGSQGVDFASSNAGERQAPSVSQSENNDHFQSTRNTASIGAAFSWGAAITVWRS